MSLSVQAPAGAHFEMEEVKTKKGTESLGEVPILVWDDVNAAIETYGPSGITDILDGTSCRVSFQSIARRLMTAKGNEPNVHDLIAQAQIDFRPGKRHGGVAKPENRAARAAKAASEKVDADIVAAFLQRVANGEISQEDLQALSK